MFSKEEFNKMIDDQMKDLSEEEKKEFFKAMMDKCCSNLPDEEYSEKISSSGKEFSHSMMGMMSAMMQGRSGARRSRMMRDMCSGMMSDRTQTQRDAQFGTEEIKDLFNDWVDLLKVEIENYTKQTGKGSVDDIATHFNLSKESIEFLLKKIK